MSESYLAFTDVNQPNPIVATSLYSFLMNLCRKKVISYEQVSAIQNCADEEVKEYKKIQILQNIILNPQLNPQEASPINEYAYDEQIMRDTIETYKDINTYDLHQILQKRLDEKQEQICPDEAIGREKCLVYLHRLEVCGHL